MDENGLKTRISALPTTPGIYIYKNKNGDILYVGKAKNLRSRVRSYFVKRADLGPMKEKMITLITDMESIATDTELEALVLEASLIRKHQPPYNVLLRDDKYYLFIKITKDIPARIFPVRKIVQDGSKYFGPYSSASSVRTTLKLLRRIFPFREEKDRPRDIIFPHVLFGRHAGLDPASTWTPGQARGDNSATTNIIRFLSGKRQEIIRTLEAGIASASKNLQYEQAALFRDQLRGIERLEGSQKVYLPNKESFDVISMSQAKNQSAGNVLQIREGKLIGKQTFLLRHRSGTEIQETLRQFIMQYYSVAQDVPKKIYIPISLPDSPLLMQWMVRGKDQEVEFVVPIRGVKKQLLAMGELNAKNLLQEEQAETHTKQASRAALDVLLQAVNVQPPTALQISQGKTFRVETYDISNIQGTLATASMIVFIDGVPAKDQYRKFKIKYQTPGVDGKIPGVYAVKPNDFAMLEEALTRRLARTQWPMPDLIIIDGGKGQLSSARKAVRLAALAHGKPYTEIPIISIAKREEELFLPNNPTPVLLPYNSPALHLIQRMRDEAHRFTITYHRSLRSKEQTKSALDDISGIGPKTKKALLQKFGSVSGIEKATDSELIETVGEKKMKLLRDWL